MQLKIESRPLSIATMQQMLFPRQFAKQLRKPRGLRGKKIGEMLAKENVQMNDWILSLLHIQPSDSVLEIGFGPGYAIKKVAAMTTSGRVTGIDFSKRMLREARKRCNEEIQKGMVQLHLGHSSHLPFEENVFHKVFAVNVLYFWEEPVSQLKEILRVLKPGGMVAIQFDASECIRNLPPVQTDIFQLRSDEEVIQMLQSAGYSKVDCKRQECNGMIGVCALGYKA